jgi:hypothetical protein
MSKRYISLFPNVFTERSQLVYVQKLTTMFVTTNINTLTSCHNKANENQACLHLKLSKSAHQSTSSTSAVSNASSIFPPTDPARTPHAKRTPVTAHAAVMIFLLRRSSTGKEGATSAGRHITFLYAAPPAHPSWMRGWKALLGRIASSSSISSFRMKE